MSAFGEVRDSLDDTGRKIYQRLVKFVTVWVKQEDLVQFVTVWMTQGENFKKFVTIWRRQEEKHVSIWYSS